MTDSVIRDLKKLFFEKCTERKKQHTEEVKCGLPLRKADYNP